MTVREKVHRIVDSLNDADLAAAERFLEYLRGAGPEDPVLQALMRSPPDDETLSSEEEAALNRALEEFRRGETKPWQEVPRGIG